MIASAHADLQRDQGAHQSLRDYLDSTTASARLRLGRDAANERTSIQDRSANRMLEAVRVIRHLTARWSVSQTDPLELKRRLIVSRGLIEADRRLSQRIELACLDEAIGIFGEHEPIDVQRLLADDLAAQTAMLSRVKEMRDPDSGRLNSTSLYALVLETERDPLALARRAIHGIAFPQLCPLQLFVINTLRDHAAPLEDLRRAYRCLLLLREGDVVQQDEDIDRLIARQPADAQFIEYFCVRFQIRHMPFPADDRPTYIAVTWTGGDPSSLDLKHCLSDKAENDREIADYRGHLTGENEVEQRALNISPVLNITMSYDPSGSPVDWEYRKGLRVATSLLPSLRPATARQRRLFLRPIGDIHRVPFEALPHGRSPLGHQFSITYVNQSILTCDTDAPLCAAGDRNTPLIIGGCDFDACLPQRTQTYLVPGRRHLFEPIDASGDEARDVQKKMAGRLLLATEATKENFTVALSIAPAVLHLATHAFFSERQRHYSPAPHTPALTITDPKFSNCSYSAIVFSGANAFIDGIDDRVWVNGDAILETGEIVRLDLRGTGIVVLSACETGIGTVELGNESDGLREAFLHAGARCVIASLWPVSDRDTRIFMGRFYEFLAQHHPASECLRLTRLAMRNVPNSVTCAFVALGGEVRV